MVTLMERVREGVYRLVGGILGACSMLRGLIQLHKCQQPAAFTEIASQMCSLESAQHRVMEMLTIPS